MTLLRFAGFLVLIASAMTARAETATVAVAANFLTTLESLQRTFEHAAEHDLVLVAGSTGQLYAQIVNGAPFDVLLSADEEHPRRLVAAKLTAAAPSTYAVGKLALFTCDANFAPLTLETLRRSDYRWLAIANPELAPYGLAAEQTLNALGLRANLEARLVRGQSVAQAFAMAETRNAELALVALSQARAYPGMGWFIEIPSALHEPLRQDAVLLPHGANNAAARAFLEFLATPGAASTIAEFGYGVVE